MLKKRLFLILLILLILLTINAPLVNADNWVKAQPVEGGTLIEGGHWEEHTTRELKTWTEWVSGWYRFWEQVTRTYWAWYWDQYWVDTSHYEWVSDGYWDYCWDWYLDGAKWQDNGWEFVDYPGQWYYSAWEDWGDTIFVYNTWYWYWNDWKSWVMEWAAGEYWKVWYQNWYWVDWSGWKWISSGYWQPYQHWYIYTVTTMDWVYRWYEGWYEFFEFVDVTRQVWVPENYYIEPLQGTVSISKLPKYVFTQWHYLTFDGRKHSESDDYAHSDIAITWSTNKPIKDIEVYADVQRYKGKGTEKIPIASTSLVSPTASGTITVRAEYPHAGIGTHYVVLKTDKEKGYLDPGPPPAPTGNEEEDRRREREWRQKFRQEIWKVFAVTIYFDIPVNGFAGINIDNANKLLLQDQFLRSLQDAGIVTF